MIRIIAKKLILIQYYGKGFPFNCCAAHFKRSQNLNVGLRIKTVFLCEQFPLLPLLLKKYRLTVCIDDPVSRIVCP